MIDRPVTNFRIDESPVWSFNQVLALGVPQRVAFGYSPLEVCPNGHVVDN
jgi:hypothetical protein